MELSADMLLANERLVRSVASALLQDEHAVSDVVQDTWMRALRRGPRLLAALPGWLRRAAANRAVDVRRATRRRRHHEGSAARDEVGESVEVAAQRLDLQRQVVAALLALHEPYRSVVLLRYYHDLQPTEIAARLQTKPATVRTQLVRAHELLRERLDRSCGNRESWAVLAVPPIATGGVAATPGFGLWLGVAAGLLCGGVWLTAFFDHGVAAVPPGPTSGSPPSPVVDAANGRSSSANRLAIEPRGLVRLQTDAGGPATNVPVWFWSAASRPLWTQPARPPQPGSDHDAQLLSPLGRLLPGDAGPCAGATDHDGAVVVPEPVPAAMTMQIAESVWWTVELPAASTLVLPPLASFRGRVKDLPAGATWDLELGGEPQGGLVGDYRVNLTTPSGSGVAFAGSLRRQALAGVDFTTNVLTVHPVRAAVTGHGVLLEGGERTQAVPATVEWSVVARLPTLTVRVHELDGTPTRRRGGVMVSGGSGYGEAWLQNGSCVFDSHDFGSNVFVRVRMADGESIVQQAELAAGVPRVVDLVLDGSNPPLRLQLADLSRHSPVCAVVQHGGNNFLGFRFDSTSVRQCFGLHAGALWVAEVGKRWEVDSPIVWERLAILTEQGAVAFADRAVGDREDVFAAWEPTAPPQDIDVGAFSGRLSGALPSSVSLDCELRAIPSTRRRWGTGDETQWFGVRQHHWDPRESYRPPAPVWRGLTLTASLRWRLRFGGRDGEELAVFDLQR